MTKLLTYAEMANKVYHVPDWNKAMMPGWNTWKFGEGNENTTGGFHGCIYKKGSEVVVVFRGTASGRDVLADARLALGICPRQAGAAADLYRRAARIFDGASITITGHSLGGGLAQVVAHWYKTPFVTFNAPPMMGTIQKTKLNVVFAPQKALRAIKASFKSGAEGHNYRLKGDVVSSRRTSTLGHYGKVHTLYHPGAHDPLSAHSMDNVVDLLSRSGSGGIDPFA